MITETIPAALAGERVDRAVAMITGCTRREATDLIDAGAVQRNDRRVHKGSERVAVDDVVAIDPSGLHAAVEITADPSIGFEVVHEDDAVLVVNKPAGLVVHPGAGTHEATLVHGLVARYPDLVGVGEPERPGIVHRLDRGTSGLLMVARTDAALADLVDQLANRTVERAYLAVVWGLVESDQGLIDAAIGRSKRHPTRMAVLADGRDARTRYEVLSRHDEPAPVSVVRCRLETGRTHQIRVHCRAIGHPVVGDGTYGGRREGIRFERPALHAEVLGFTHPDTGERLRFEVAPPPDLVALLDSLRQR